MKKYMEVIRKYKKSLLILALFSLLSGVLVVREHTGFLPESTAVSRQADGSSSESRTFSYQIEDGDLQEVTLEIRPQQRTREEAQVLLEQAVAEWEELYLGRNVSANNVCYKLNLPEQLCEGLVSVSYESSDYNILEADGTILLENLGDEGTLVELTAEFSYADYSRRESRWLKAVLPKEDSAEWLKLKLTQALIQTEADTRESESFQLPTAISGHSINWISEEEPQWINFLCLGIVAVICLELRKKEQERKAKKEREASLLFDYPQMVEQISLLLGSGMTIRGAWERILLTDQKMRSVTKDRLRPFVEEMWITYREISGGCGEKDAYERFGMRIGLIPYRCFGSMLSQNLSKGTRDICRLLEEEARSALGMRKNHARKLGEEAGTKMLFPMLLMFVLILMVLLVPAIQNFR